MKKALALFAVVLAFGMTAALDAEAKRLGGGRSSGMQRQNVTAPQNNTPATPGNAAQQSPGQAAPAAGTAAAAAGTAAAASKRSWMGPIAGIAAGLGLAALASHFGFGEALANMLTIGLIIMAVLLVVGLIMRKRAASQRPAAAGMGSLGSFRTAANEPQPQMPSQPQSHGGSMIGSRLGANLGGTPAAVAIPADFDVAGFVRNAKSQFMALQAANDAGDFDRLREYLSPEMFEVVREEVRSRGDVAQRTEVFGLDAQVLEVLQEGNRYIVSVRFTGSVREQPGAMPEDLDEIWHLVKPRDGQGGWVIAGIQQTGSTN